MRATILALLFLFAIPTWAQSQETKKSVPPIANQAKGTEKSKHNTESEQKISIEFPSTINVTVGGKLEMKSQNDNAQRHEEGTNWAEWLVALSTALLVVVTAYLVHYTKNLWGATKTLAEDAKRTADRQARETQESMRIAKESTDATLVASMPILSPYIINGGRLHPFKTDAAVVYPSDQPVNFNSHVLFVFENFGRTPGAIRELRADLFLTRMNEFPPVQFDQLPLIHYQPIVPGESRGENALMGGAECEKQFSLTAIEFDELLATNGRRFALIGRVIYDDFFGSRHIRTFCIKMRRLDTGFFQLVRGGKAYNHIERYKIPENDPLTEAF